jgi:hypothetical protein
MRDDQDQRRDHQLRGKAAFTGAPMITGGEARIFLIT